MNLIGGQKYVVVMTILACHIKSAPVTEFMVISH